MLQELKSYSELLLFSWGEIDIVFSLVKWNASALHVTVPRTWFQRQKVLLWKRPYNPVTRIWRVNSDCGLLSNKRQPFAVRIQKTKGIIFEKGLIQIERPSLEWNSPLVTSN